MFNLTLRSAAKCSRTSARTVNTATPLLFKQQHQQLLSFPQFRFSSIKNEVDEKTRQVFDELKSKDDLGTGVSRFSKQRTFSSYTVYEHPMDNKEIGVRIKLRLLTSSIWFGCGVAVFHFVNQWAAFIPLIIMSRSIMSYQVGRKYTKSLIQKLEISEDLKTVKLHAVSGDIYESAIAEMDFQSINDLSELKKDDNQIKEDPNSDIAKLKRNSFLAIFDTTDLKGVYHRDLKLLFNDQLVTMENAELLTRILRGDTDTVNEFKFVTQSEKEQSNHNGNDDDENISDEKLTELLQEEIRKRKQ